MMKRKNILVFVFMFIFLFATIAQVSAFMPKNTHRLIHETAMAEQVDSDWYRACQKYPTLCYTGNVLTDVSVIWYWTEGYKYSVTHSPNFCRGLIESAENEQEYACAIGGCMHQPADIASHSEKDGVKGLVPTTIENSFLANNIIHVFAEQKVDTWVVDNYPGIEDTAETALIDYDACVPLFKRVMLGYEEYGDITEEEVDVKFEKFITEIQNSKTGYDPAFEKKSFLVNFKSLPFSIIAIYAIFMSFFLLVSILLVIKIIKKDAKVRHIVAVIIFGFFAGILIYIFVANLTGSAFQAVLNVASPISKLVPIGESPQTYVNNGIENTKEFLREGPQWLTDTEASGFTALEKADKKILPADYVILVILVILMIWYLYYLFKSNKIKAKDTFNL